MKKHRLTKVTAIVIGALITIPTIIVFFLMSQGLFARASGSAPEGVRISQITSSGAVVNWTTGQDTQGVIQYGTAPALQNLVAAETVQSTIHRVELATLKPSTTYYFTIRIGDEVYDNGGVPWSFTTKTTQAAQVATDSAQVDTPVSQAPSPDPDDDIDVDIDFDDDGTIVYVLSPTLRASTPTPPTSPLPTLKSSTPTRSPVAVTATSGVSAPTATTTLTCPSTTNCTTVYNNLGRGCTMTDYWKCLKSTTPSPSPSPSVTPPADPSDLTATASAGTVTLTWTDNSLNETEFRVFRSTDPINAFEQKGVKVISDDPGSGQAVSITLNNQTSGVTFYYKVYSYIGSVRSKDSSNTTSIAVP